MSTNTAVTSEPDDGTVMASVDEGGHEPRLVIADVSRDGAWVSMPCAGAVAVENWR